MSRPPKGFVAPPLLLSKLFILQNYIKSTLIFHSNIHFSSFVLSIPPIIPATHTFRPQYRQLPLLLSALPAYQFRHLYRRHLPHIHIVHGHEPVAHVDLIPYRTSVFDRMHHWWAVGGGPVDHDPELARRGDDLEHLLPLRRGVIVVVGSGGHGRTFAIALFDGMSRRGEWRRRHGAERRPGMGEVSEGLIPCAERALGVGDVRPVAQFDVFVVGVYRGNANIVVSGTALRRMFG